MSKMLSWSERFALIDHYKPSDEQICTTFQLSQDELATARQLLAAGTFRAAKNFDLSKYGDVFTINNDRKPAVVRTSDPRLSVDMKPSSDTAEKKLPQKRGRKGDKISQALLAIPTTRVDAEQFVQQHNVSINVLKQAKRFVENLDPTVRENFGTVFVRQDKLTKRLMIWRELP